MNSPTPMLSVVMAVYNGERYLVDAIESILSQTYTDFEFLIVNDGSTDSTDGIIQEYLSKEERIIYIKNTVNSGQSESWNRAIRQARGKYIVRMDADDISLPERFKTQYDYMEAHPDTGVLGTSYLVFSNDKNDTVQRQISHTIRDGMPPVHHPTCCIRRILFEQYGGYNSRYDHAEDMELWYRFFSKGVKFENIDTPLFLYRLHGNNVSLTKVRQQVCLQLKINFLALFKYQIRFSYKGYLRILEQLFYLTYLSLGLNAIYQRGEKI